MGGGVEPVTMNKGIDYPTHLNNMWQKAIAPRDAAAPTVISTFAGGGGSLTGYMMAGFRDLLAVEWDDNAVETLRLNWPELDIYHGDIAKLTVDEVLKRTGLKPGELDILDGSPPCFPAGSSVLTECGKIPIEFCTVGTRVLTHTGQLKGVSHVFSRKYNGQLYTIETKYGRKLVTSTPEHPFWARRRAEKTRDSATRKNGTKYKVYDKPEWIAAKDLHIGDVICEPHATGNAELNIPKVILKQRINIEGVSGTGQSEMVLLERDCSTDWKSNDMAWILGFYLAEGHTRGRNPTLEENGACRREVNFSIAEKEILPLIERLNNSNFHTTAQKNGRGSARVTISSVDFWALCQTMGKYADGKFVPTAFMCMPVEWQSEFLDGYFSGDGCIVASKRINSQKRKATTVSWDIATGIAKMVARVFGLVSSIEVLYPAGRSTIEGRDVEIKEAYSVGYTLPTSNRVRPGFVDEDGAWLPIKSISISDTDDTDVFNLEVEDDNSYTAEGVAVHNCQGFSSAGKRVMDDPRNQLFREYVRLLRGLMPKVFVMENVSGMVKGKMKLIFVDILKELKASGYRVKACLLNAKYFHVPQSRERMIFIGVREDLGIEPSHPKGESKPVTLRDALSPECNHKQNAPGMTTEKTRRWTATKRGDANKVRFSTLRLHWGKTPPTILKTPGSGGHFHPDVPRLLDTGELQRIASFPDGYNFAGEDDFC